MKYEFKTNINCAHCVKSVSRVLDNLDGLSYWSVDTDNPEKILSVELDGIDKEAVIKAVESAGFEIE